jgi:uroporphyrinogen decarboxylase
MNKMTPKERFIKTLSFEKVDRIPLMDYGYWEETIANWHKQGLPENVKTTDDVETYFGLDRGFETNAINYWTNVPVGYQWGIFPPCERTVIEEDERTITYSGDGGILVVRKDGGCMPFYKKHMVESMEDFERKVIPRMNARDKQRLTPDFFNFIKQGKETNQAIGMWIDGFFAWPRILLGDESLLFFYYEKPELIHAINKHHIQFVKDYTETALEYTNLDYAWFFEDMAYNLGSMISPDTFDEFMKPYYLELIEFLREKGIAKILVDSDGNTVKLCAKFAEVGIDGHFPLEVNAGSEPALMRELYPNMAFLGGIRKAQLALGKDAIDRELSKLPEILKKGGYIPTLDHRCPPEVSFENYRYYIEQKREILADCNCTLFR